jgi:hypothetical protein
MKDFERFTQQFIVGLRSVPGYVDSLCHSCKGACGERPDDQCLISAWSDYIQGAFDNGYDPQQSGKRCAMAQLQQRETPARIQLPCERDPVG